MFARFFNRNGKKQKPSTRPPRRRVLLGFEWLEDRNVPSVTLVDFEDLSLAPNSYWNGSDNSGGFISRGSSFNNSFDQTFGTWSGWSYSDVNNTTTPGFANQYAAFTGTGVGGSGNYAVGFCSDPAFGGVLPTITIPDGMQVQSGTFTNTTYAGLSMLNGDAFAKKFGPNDWFDLTITGKDAGNHALGSVDFYLAQNGTIVSAWQSVNLSSLAAAKTLQFSLTSSDTGAFGMNTPAFFALDNLTLAPTPTATTTTVSASPSTVVYGNPITFTATVTAASGSAGATAGSVNFKDTTTGKDLGNGSLVVGAGASATATITVAANNANLFKVSAADTIVATYTAGAGFAGSAGNTTIKVNAGTLVDFEDLSLTPNSYWNGSDNSGGFISRGSSFNNSFDQTFGTWSGWSYSDVNNTTTPGFANQYAAFTGTGVGGSGNYAVGFCSDPAFGGVLPTITIPDGMQVQSGTFTNTTYAGLSMLNGDAFAKKFGPNDWFDLTITGKDAGNHVLGSVDFYLAQNGTIVSAWQSVNLSSLAAAKTLQFSLTSSDTGAFGMNTPAFFALDDLTLAPRNTTYAVSLVGGKTVTAGSTFLVTVQASDGAGNPLPSYSGPATATISASDSRGTFPTTVSLNSSGFGFFIGTMKTVGAQAITATAGAFTGTASSITVVPAGAAYFTVVTPASASTGSAFNVTVTALDLYGNIATGYSGHVHFSGSDTAASLPADLTLTGGTGVVPVTLKTAGNQSIAATDTLSTTPTITGTSAAIITRGLTVSAFAPTPTGFTVHFSKPFDPAKITMYGVGNTIHDVTLVGAGGPITGTLIIDPTNTSATFKATAIPLDFVNTVINGGVDSVVLPDDTYTVTLKSGAAGNGFFDLLGAGLDGAGTAGHADYTATFTTHYQANKTPVFALPDFARGPDDSQPIKAPNNTGHGIPVTLYNAVGLMDATVTVLFDPSLLANINALGGTGSDATDPGSAFSLVPTPGVVGQATFTFHSSAPLSGNVVLGDILANVPGSAKSNYKAKELISFVSATVNGAAFTGVTAAGVHVNAYFGDVSGDGAIGAPDVNPMFSVAVGTSTGFSAYSLVDPVIVGDVANDISVDGGDVATLKSYILHFPRPVIPTPPGLAGIVSPNAADPTLSLVSGGEPPLTTHQPPLTVSVMLDHPHPDGSTGVSEAVLGLKYDASILNVTAADISLGFIPGLDADWQLSVIVDEANGLIGIEMYGAKPLTSSQAESLVNIRFHARTEGTAAVELLDGAWIGGQFFGTMLADEQGGMVLSAGVSRILLNP